MFDKELKTLNSLTAHFYKLAMKYDRAAQNQPKGNDDEFVMQQLLAAATSTAEAAQNLVAIRNRFHSPTGQQTDEQTVTVLFTSGGEATISIPPDSDIEDEIAEWCFFHGISEDSVADFIVEG